MKAALVGIYVMIALVLVNVATVQAIAPNGVIVVEDVVIGLVFVAIVVGISRRAVWSRFAGIAVSALFALGSVSLFQAGVPGIVVVVGVVQLAALIGVVVLLLLRPSGDWFRGLS